MFVVKKLLLKIILAIEIFAIIIYSVLAHFIVKVDSVSGVMTDGLGRVIVEPPLFFKWYLQLGEWVGLGWFIIDTIGFGVALFIAYALYEKITDKK